VERARIAPGDTVVTPLAFEHYPISHSLLAAAAWAGLVGLLYLWLRRERRGAVLLALLVLSHWLLDAIVHRPDLPLYPNSATVVGLGLWNSMAATVAAELSVFALGVWLYVRATQPIDATSRWGRWGLWGLVATLLLIQLSNLLGPPPPSMEAVAWVGQAQWLLVLWGYTVDKHRRVVGELRPSALPP
jgi:membrane-bound metal-dependent hydrolase YbcI (DUF457 family)